MGKALHVANLNFEPAERTLRPGSYLLPRRSSIGTTVFASPTCALKALQVLQRTGADPCKLKMEPTKSVAVDDMEGMTA